MYEEHNKPEEDDGVIKKPLSLKEREDRDMAFFEKRFQERVNQKSTLFFIV